MTILPNYDRDLVGKRLARRLDALVTDIIEKADCAVSIDTRLTLNGDGTPCVVVNLRIYADPNPQA